MLQNLRSIITSVMSHISVKTENSENRPKESLQINKNVNNHRESNKSEKDVWGKIPRNSKCPCGSGKKYKHCHGKLI